MRIFLITLLLMFGTQATAKTVNGSKAVDLILKAHNKGLIIEKECSGKFCSIVLLLKGRYYDCILSDEGQFCRDFTKN